ncbi:MAG: hypothetical protein GEV13_28335 [Rhodospirillales bacterium]|nr:hypothetical protein [Rhodospirillales bacterium]
MLAHIDRIAEISASATGARIVLQQVQEKVVELRRLVVVSARMHMTMAQRMGRWGPAFTAAEMEAIRQESEDLMREAGVDEADIASVKRREWDRYVHLDYVFWIFKNVKTGDARDDRDKVRNVQSPGTPDEVEALLTKLGAMTEERRERLEMYRHYLVHGKHRDPEAWATKDKQ